MAYADLREYLQALDRAGLLRRVAVEVDRDWEVAAVCRQTFRRIPSEGRPALLFERVRGFDMPIAAGILGASRQVYATALQAGLADVGPRWEEAQRRPLDPVLVSSGPCKQNVQLGDAVRLDRLPVPVWTAGHDPGPYFTAPCVITRDPETGRRNVGTYRMQYKGPRKTGLFASYHQDIQRHVRLNEAAGRPTPVAVVLGADPSVGLVSVANPPYGVDELAVAGGLRGEPLELVRCETVDLEVPATAEIVIEGRIPCDYREAEGPFGEFTGYMGPGGQHFVIEVTALTYRDDAIFHAFVSQMPPSESSCIRGLGQEWTLLKHLREHAALPVTDVHFKEAGGSAAYLVIALKKEFEGQPKQAIWSAWGWDGGLGKYTVVVDDDIDVRDPFAVDWAISFRTQPARDVFVVPDAPQVRLDPSLGPANLSQQEKNRLLGSKVGIDATRKHAYPPLSLPPQADLDRVAADWERYGIH